MKDYMETLSVDDARTIFKRKPAMTSLTTKEIRNTKLKAGNVMSVISWIQRITCYGAKGIST